MLQEVQLLVARSEREVITRRALSTLLRAEGWVCQDHVIRLLARASRRERVAQLNLPLDAVQHRVHERQSVRVVHEFAPSESLLALEGLFLGAQVKVVVGLRLHVGVSGNHEPECPARRIVASLAGLRLHKAHHDVNEHSRREVLTGTGLLLVRVLLEQALVQVAEALLARRVPIETVDALDDLLEIGGLVDVRRGALVNLSNPPGSVLSELVKQLPVVALQLDTGPRPEVVPAVALG